MLANGGIDANDPQSAEIPFSHTTIAVGINLCPYQCFLDGSQQVSAAATISLGSLVESSLGLVTSRTLRCPWHDTSSFSGCDQVFPGSCYRGTMASWKRFLPTQLVRELFTFLILIGKPAGDFPRLPGQAEWGSHDCQARSVAISIECFTDGWFHATIDGCRSSQVTFSLV